MHFFSNRRYECENNCLLLFLQTKDLTGWMATRVSPPPLSSVIVGSTSILNISLFYGLYYKSVVFLHFPIAFLIVPYFEVSEINKNSRSCLLIMNYFLVAANSQNSSFCRIRIVFDIPRAKSTENFSLLVCSVNTACYLAS